MPKVTFVTNGTQISINVPGSLLPVDLPSAILYKTKPNGDVELQHAPADQIVGGNVDEYAGMLLLPYVRREAGERVFETATLLVPPRPPWRFSHLQHIWTDLSNSPIDPGFLQQQGVADWRGRSLEVGPTLRSAALGELVRAGRSLVASWPTRYEMDVVWKPIGIRYGRELAAQTEREIGRRTQEAVWEGARVVDRSARARARLVPWRSPTIASVSRELVHQLESARDGAAVGEMDNAVIELVSTIGERMAGTDGFVDVQQSSWPFPFLVYYQAAVRSLSILSMRDDYKLLTPLSEVWRLYEVWVASQIVERISEVLGVQGQWRKEDSGFRWNTDAVRVDLLYQRSVLPNQHLRVGGLTLISTTGELKPDLLIAVSTSSGGRVLAIDPKRRFTLTQSTVVTEGSKYLWGIRQVGDLERPVLEEVILVAPMSGPNAVLREGRIRTIHASPGGDSGVAVGTLGDDISESSIRKLLNKLTIP
jgi:hypothetical protein